MTAFRRIIAEHANTVTAALVTGGLLSLACFAFGNLVGEILAALTLVFVAVMYSWLSGWKIERLLFWRRFR